LSILDNETNEFAIDRLLVKIAFSNHRLLPVNPTTFKEFLITEEIELNSIPTVLFPLIITLYGGLKRDGKIVVFDPYYIYRESIAVTPILIHFLSRSNRDWQDQNIIIFKEECLRTLLTRIENQDESYETVDLCIAIVCLYGIDYVRQNVKILSNYLLRTSMNRLKYISMILRQFYFTDDENDRSIENETTKFISTVREKFQYGKSTRVQFLNLLNSLRSSLARLRSSTTSILLKGNSKAYQRVRLYLPNSLRIEKYFLNYLLSTDIQLYPDRKSCSLLHHFTKLFWILEHNDKYETQYRMSIGMDTIAHYVLLRNDEDPLFPLTFISQHLHNLYIRLLEQGFIVINPKDLTDDNGHHLYFGHILLECLMVLSNTSCNHLCILSALIALLPCLRMHQLENFGSSLLWTLHSKDSRFIDMFEIIRHHPMNYETGRYINKDEEFLGAKAMTDEKRRTLIEKCIEQEHQRLRNALDENHGTSMKIYSACVSLVRLCRWSDDKNRLHLLEESVQGAMLINNKLVRLDALCMIAFYSHSDYNKIQVSQERFLQNEIEHQLNDVYPDLPLLLHAAIFIRCLPLLQKQQTIDKCLQDLFNKFNDASQNDQQVVYEALLPYLDSSFACASVLEQISNSSLDYNKIINKKSSILMEYLTNKADEKSSNTMLISNLYLVELVSDLQKSVADDDLHLVVSYSNLPTTGSAIKSTLFQFEGPILTTTHVFAITNILSSHLLTNQSKDSEKLYRILNNILHRFNLVEFKACRLLEPWMKWKDSNVLSSFAYHAALLLTNSDFWSVEAATIISDLLCSENDRFRQRAEMIFRSKNNDNDIRTSSKLGLDVLLTLHTKKSHYQHTSPPASLTLVRVLENTTVDIPSHLETLLWLERYRIHALTNKKYIFSNSRMSPISHVISYFPNDITMEVPFCNDIGRISSDLIQYMCTLIISSFSSFLEIDGDKTTNTVLDSHTQFVVSVLVVLVPFIYIDETRHLVIDALITLMKISKTDEIRRAAAYALGYVCDKKTYKILFHQLEILVNKEADENINNSDQLLCSLISSYCHCLSVYGITFDKIDIELFRRLLKYSSSNVLKAVHVGLARVLKNTSLLYEMLDSDYIQCYHALIDSTAYVLVYAVQEKTVDAAAEFLEQHPDILPIFVVELYNSIRHFTSSVHYGRTTDYYLAYAYPRHVRVASSIAVRMPATFCTFIKDWQDGDKLKRALFYTSKQHNYPQRAACLTVLSVFGELTVELCEMIIEALRDDPYIQNTCHKCLTRINSIKNEKAVFNLLFSYLKSKSMNVRYVTAKILLHLSQSSLIPSKQVQTVLNDLILDPDSNEDLWLIKDQDNIVAKCVYYYAGPLKDVIYSLLVQHLTGDASEVIQRNELNDIDADFVESEKAARLASCLYEERTNENLQMTEPAKMKSVD
jgi:hypothetical protein